jgi:hypothetical protein
MDSIIEEKFIFINPFPEAFKIVERALAPKKPLKGTIEGDKEFVWPRTSQLELALALESSVSGE